MAFWDDWTTAQKVAAFAGVTAAVGGGTAVAVHVAKQHAAAKLGTVKQPGPGSAKYTGGIPTFSASSPCIDLLVRSPSVLSWNVPSGSSLGAISTYGGATKTTGQGDVNISFDGTSAAVGVDWTDPSGVARHTTIVNIGQTVQLTDKDGDQQNILVTVRQFVRVIPPADATVTLDFSAFTGGVNRVVDDLSQQHDSYDLPVAGSCPILSVDGQGSVQVGMTTPAGYIHNKISANGG